MSKLLYNFSIKIGHVNIIAVIQGPDIFIAILASVGHRWASVSMLKCGSINNMFAIFCKKGTGASSLSVTDHFVFKLVAGLLRNFTNEDLVAIQSLFRIGALKNNVFAVITPVSFCIVSA